MATVSVPSLSPGERSLPAELRTWQGGSNFAQRRLAANLQPSANPTYFNNRRLLGLGGVSGSSGYSGCGLRGLGQDDSDSGDLGSSFGFTGTGSDGSSTLMPLGSNTNENIDTLDTPISSVAAVTYNATGANASGYFQTLGVDPSTASSASAYVAAPAGYSGPTVTGPSASTPAAPSGYQWAQLVNSEGNTLAKVLTIAQGGSSVTLPNGTQLLYGSSTSAANASGALGALSTLTGINSSTLLLIGGAVLVFMLLEKK